jgi:hypothetical protein
MAMFPSRKLSIKSCSLQSIVLIVAPSLCNLRINCAYNHHHDTAVVGKGSTLEKVDRNHPRVKQAGREYIRLDGGQVWLPREHTPSPNGIPTRAMFSDGNGGEYRKSFHAYPPPFAQLVHSPDSFAGAPMQIDTWNRDKMNITGSKFVPGPYPKHSLAPVTGPDAHYSGIFECPLTSRIQKIYSGGGSGFNDTYAAKIFGCGSTNSTPETAPTNFESKYNGQCLDVAGKKTSDGAEVNTWNCVQQSNEKFSYDAASGHFVDSNSKKCMSTDCPAKGGLCIKTCDEKSAAARWTVSRKDGTIRPRNAAGSCLQVDSKALDAPLSIGMCSTPPTSHQVWTAAAPQPLNACKHNISDADACFASAKGMPALSNSTIATKTVSDATLPPGCTVSASPSSSNGKAFNVVFNSMLDSKVCCGAGPESEVAGEAKSLVTLGLKVSAAKKTPLATITLTGPADKVFACTSSAVLAYRY